MHSSTTCTRFWKISIFNCSECGPWFLSYSWHNTIIQTKSIAANFEHYCNTRIFNCK